ncbi:ATP-binding cassette domain-containing protein [Anaerotalea alkaliphila]|uniref:ATP-binding cassette domain-containing protein n=1 Tax=Anaerotalea alkaliphila TaxID=2662126 RepID=A0A7X5HW76_9FIRM|nr:ATP-binding cassette domain-containing protein [Anaerotalea alkaliphila]NDL67793.1 ATP-binding cassette domain-containing protein [Anaerotalea alkaliphila]
MDRTNGITLHELTKTWPQPGGAERLTVFSGLSHTFPPGSRTAIVGPSGSGKTTLLQMVAGLEAPDGGFVEAPKAPELGYVFQSPALWPHKTVRSNMRYGLGEHLFSGADPLEEARYRDILQALELEDLQGKYPATLSGGQAKRVSLARTLVTRPSCLLLDEPLGALDGALKDRVLDFLLEWVHWTEATLLYVTHDHGEARRICTRVLEVRDQGLVEVG